MKFFFLPACSTCQRIIKEIGADKNASIEMRDIKSNPMTKTEVEAMKKLNGTYESLFSRRAMKYKSMGLKDMDLKEADYKKYILEEYTFLKRPVLMADETVFVGNAKKVTAAMKSYLES